MIMYEVSQQTARFMNHLHYVKCSLVFYGPLDFMECAPKSINLLPLKVFLAMQAISKVLSMYSKKLSQKRNFGPGK